MKPVKISIHALRGEGDAETKRENREAEISIHALRGEGDKESTVNNPDGSVFQSTPSVGRATYSVNRITKAFSDFNPRPPWGGRRLHLYHL